MRTFRNSPPRVRPGLLKALPFPSSLPLRTFCSRLAGGLTLCSKCPGNGTNRRLRNSPSPWGSRRTSGHRRPRLSLLMTNPRAATSSRCQSGTPAAPCQPRPLYLLLGSTARSPDHGAYASHQLPSYRSASSALSFQILAQSRRPLPPPLPSCKACGVGTCLDGGTPSSCTVASRGACTACRERLPVGG